MTGYTLAAEKFQSTPPVKAATCAPVTAAVTPLFQSTPPVKAATDTYLSQIVNRAFQSTPPVKAATFHVQARIRALAISIHAAREGGDSRFRVCRHPTQAISIHAAREGGDRCRAGSGGLHAISIHAAREGGDRFTAVCVHKLCISIHAAREGGDPCICVRLGVPVDFNPRRP